MAKYNIKITPETKTHIVAGNIKTGAIAQYNTLPGNKPLTLNDGTVLTDIVGMRGLLRSQLSKALLQHSHSLAGRKHAALAGKATAGIR